MKTQSSSTDIRSTEKLTTRMAANRNASRDFDEWCVRQLPELPMPARIMDLGAGTGKQVHLFSPLFSPKSDLYALDLEGASLQTLEEAYQGKAHLQVMVGNFDELPDFPNLEADSFDLIYSSYALYYTEDLNRVIESVFQLLKKGGVFWVIAPYIDTNREFLDLIRPLHEVEPFMDYVFNEFHQDVIALGEVHGFAHIKPSLLRNQIRFADGDAFLTYLSNSLFYRPGHDEAIRQAVNEICSREGSFNVSKNVISLQLKK